MYTFKYKNAYIHDNFTENRVTVQIFDGKSSFFTKEVKNVRAAKIFITKWMNSLNKWGKLMRKEITILKKYHDELIDVTIKINNEGEEENE